MSNAMSRELIMKNYIDMMRLRYDYILIDSMSSLGMMDLLVAGRSQRELLNSIPFYKENKLVQTVLKRVDNISKKSLFPGK